MTTIAIPQSNILIPRLEFPAWLRRRGAQEERVARMFSGAFRKPFQNAFASAGAASEANWWDITGIRCAYQPKGAATLAASYVNLANPGTNNASLGVAPTFDTATGWTVDGATQYLKTGLIFLSGWSMVVRFSDVGATGALVIAGASNGTNRNMIAPTRDVASATYYYGTGFANASPQMTSGVIALIADFGYRNGIVDTTSIGSFSASHGLETYIGCVNSSGSPALFLPCKIQAFAMVDDTAIAAQVAQMMLDMAAL